MTKDLNSELEELKESIKEITGIEEWKKINKMVSDSYELDKYSEKREMNYEYEVNVVSY